MSFLKTNPNLSYLKLKVIKLSYMQSNSVNGSKVCSGLQTGQANPAR